MDDHSIIQITEITSVMFVQYIWVKKTKEKLQKT